MEFRLTDDQLELQAAIRGYCDAQYPLARVLVLAENGSADGAADDWGRLSALDVFRIAAPVAQGGLGLGMVEAAAVFEVLGAALVPGPLVWSALAARHLPDLSDGDACVGGLDVAPTIGTAAIVEHASRLDALVVLRPEGVHVVDAATLAAAHVEQVDPTDPLTPVALVRDLPDGRLVADATVADQVRLDGALLTAALLTGIAQRAVDAGVAYTSEREQFGRPVGSFQAVKHLLADAYVRASLARSALYAAAATADDPSVGDAGRRTRSAKLLAIDAAVRNARTCIQVHGGMGFTWEMVPHLLLKRAWVHEHQFGRRDAHAEVLGAALAAELREVAGD